MKLSVDRKALLAALTHISGAVEARSVLPILCNVLIATDGDTATLVGTDLDIEVEAAVEASVKTQGAVTVPATTLRDIAKKGDSEKIIFTLKDERLKITAGKAEFTLGTLPAEDFGRLKSESGQTFHDVTLPAESLRRLIDRTRHAMSQEETRYYLNGIYLHTVERDGAFILRAVATDGSRLALAEEPVEIEALLPSVIVPKKAVSEIRKLLDGAPDEVGLSLSQTLLRLRCGLRPPDKIPAASGGGATLTTKLIDATFPDYERVIPKNNEKSATINARLFEAAAERCRVTVGDSNALKISLAAGKITLFSKDGSGNSAEEELDAVYDGPETDIGMNAGFLIETLKHLQGDFEFSFSGTTGPTLCRLKDDPSFLYVLMPMRV